MSAIEESGLRLLSEGNAAKLYCLEAIERRIHDGSGALRIIDLGCGTGRNFVELLRRHPDVSYLGVEPDASACAAARVTLAGLPAEIVHAAAYGFSVAPADIVVSFSVLEHVYRRSEYMRTLAGCMKADGVAFVNYDSGHFVWQRDLRHRSRERAKTLIGGLLARTGRESRFQSFVHEDDFRRWVTDAGLTMSEAKVFNTRLKNTWAVIPETERTRFMRDWLDFELRINELDLRYSDDLSEHFFTRNFVLQHA